MFGVIASFVTSVSFEELWDVHERFATVPCNVADAVQGCDNDFYGMYG